MAFCTILQKLVFDWLINNKASRLVIYQSYHIVSGFVPPCLIILEGRRLPRPRGRERLRAWPSRWSLGWWSWKRVRGEWTLSDYFMAESAQHPPRSTVQSGTSFLAVWSLLNCNSPKHYFLQKKNSRNHDTSNFDDSNIWRFLERTIWSRAAIAPRCLSILTYANSRSMLLVLYEERRVFDETKPHFYRLCRWNQLKKGNFAIGWYCTFKQYFIHFDEIQIKQRRSRAHRLLLWLKARGPVDHNEVQLAHAVWLVDRARDVAQWGQSAVPFHTTLLVLLMVGPMLTIIHLLY